MSIRERDTFATDQMHVVLTKSLATNNRFYTLVPSDSPLRNADTVDCIPDELILGIAYPCLEDGLNDFAVIRTTYETLDYFPPDDEMRGELLDIIADARDKLIRRLSELRERIASGHAYFLGTDLEEFKSYAMDIATFGYSRRNLDSMMKLDVFSSVADQESHDNGADPLYRYEFRSPNDREMVAKLPPSEFIASLFSDVLKSVEDDSNYVNKYVFDRNIFQKFIALMFVNYATTDPIFYGTNKDDYGVSGERDMQDTSLYRAIHRELAAILARLSGASLIVGSETHRERVANPELPTTLINEDVLMQPITAICAAAKRLVKLSGREAPEFGRLILKEASNLIAELKRLGIVSPVTYDPGTDQVDRPHACNEKTLSSHASHSDQAAD